MSYIDQNDGIRYADGDEEYHVTGYMSLVLPVDFTTSHEEGSERFEDDLWEAVESSFERGGRYLEDNERRWLDIEIVKREWRD